MDPDTASVSVLLADDHKVVALGIQKLLTGCVRHIEAVSSGESLLEAMSIARPDVVLLDIEMPGISGMETLQTLRQRGLTVPVVMLTMYDDASLVRRALALGATGYVVKHASGDELLMAIAFAVRGERFISPSIDLNLHRREGHESGPFVPTTSQKAVLRLVATGMRPKQIGATLGLSRRTVESHKYMMMQELGIRTTIELIAWAEHEGYIW